MPELIGDHLRGNTGSDHERGVRVPQIVEREPLQGRAANGRPEYARHEVVLPPNTPLRGRKEKVDLSSPEPTKLLLGSSHGLH
jgi:hypothetical protein